MVTFYPSGNLRRFFPLNGKVTGYWTESDEIQSAASLPIQTPLGELSLKVIYVQFHENGHLQILSLWPGQTLRLPTPMGEVLLRKGLSFDAHGNLNSFEPHEPLTVSTPIGDVEAYEPDPKGMSAENNSLKCSPDGRVQSVSTVGTQVEVMDGEKSYTYAPRIIPSLCSDAELSTASLTILFKEDEVVFKEGLKTLGRHSHSAHYQTTVFEDKVLFVQHGC